MTEKRTPKERQLAQDVNDPKRIAREKVRREKDRKSRQGNGKPKE